MNVVVPFLAMLVSLMFAVSVFDQWLGRRRPYQLVWTVGILTILVGTGSEFVIAAFGVSEPAFRLWYLCGAVYAAAYLGMGSVYLHAPFKLAHVIMGVLLLASIYAAAAVFSANADMERLQDVIAQGGRLTGKGMWLDSVRWVTIPFNIFGTVALVGGALYSAIVFWGQPQLRYRVVSNILILAGALVFAAGGTAARLGQPSLLYVSELLGVTVIFLGFLRSREVFGLYRFPLVHGFGRTP